MSFLTTVWGLIPPKYKWEVGLKKAAYTVAKFGIGALAGTKIGNTVSPDNWLIVTEVSGALIAGGLTAIHDFLHMKYPEAKWL